MASLLMNRSIDESGTNSDMQNQDIAEEKPESNNEGEPLVEEEQTKSPDLFSAQMSLQQSNSTGEVQGSFRSLIFPGEDVRSILVNTSFIPKVPSDFELTPYSVESELLQPIAIDSDLLLLNVTDSFMDLSLEDHAKDGDDGDKAE